MFPKRFPVSLSTICIKLNRRDAITINYEYIQAASAASGDEVTLLRLSDKKRLRILLPSDEEMDSLALLMYKKVVGKHVSDTILCNNKEFKIISIIKPDATIQHCALMQELASLLNGVFHFGFLTSYFSYYISDCFNESIYVDNESTKLISNHITSTSEIFKENLLKNVKMEFKNSSNIPI